MQKNNNILVYISMDKMTNFMIKCPGVPLSSHNGYSKGRRKAQSGSVAAPKNVKGFRLGIQIVKHALEENCSSGVGFALHGNV